MNSKVICIYKILRNIDYTENMISNNETNCLTCILWNQAPNDVPGHKRISKKARK